jgi:hypothetical protein
MPHPRWYPALVAGFAATLITSNIIAVKIFDFFGLALPVAVVLFPVAYILGDVLTEVYGYAQARRAIWIGFACNLIAVAAIWIGDLLPAAPFWDAGAYPGPQEAGRAYQAILGFSPRLLASSFAAYLVGEFLNSFVLARLKVRTAGRYLWTRTITSTLIGQAADSAVFLTLAFYGILPTPILLSSILAQWLVKTAFEAAATPLTYVVVNSLKRVEGLDVFDRETSFSPLRF